MAAEGSDGGKDFARLTQNAAPATSRVVTRMLPSRLVTRRPDPASRRAVTLTPQADSLRPSHSLGQTLKDTRLFSFQATRTAPVFALLAQVETAGRVWLATP